MNQPKRIFIIGHSGAGKGVFAAALAKKLSWQFLDADFALAPSIGKPLIQILGKQGEENFHQCLLDILSNQISKENIVVTTDDSIICSNKSRQLLASEFTVYLKVSTPVQLERIAHNRPLLSIVDYKAFLDKLHHERDSLFEEVATLTIESISVEEDVNKIIKALEE